MSQQPIRVTNGPDGQTRHERGRVAIEVVDSNGARRIDLYETERDADVDEWTQQGSLSVRQVQHLVMLLDDAVLSTSRVESDHGIAPVDFYRLMAPGDEYRVTELVEQASEELNRDVIERTAAYQLGRLADAGLIERTDSGTWVRTDNGEIPEPDGLGIGRPYPADVQVGVPMERGRVAITIGEDDSLTIDVREDGEWLPMWTLDSRAATDLYALLRDAVPDNRRFVAEHGVTPERVLELLDTGEPYMVGEVQDLISDELGEDVPSNTLKNYLNRLVDQGDLQRKKAGGRRYIWWQSEDSAEDGEASIEYDEEGVTFERVLDVMRLGEPYFASDIADALKVAGAGDYGKRTVSNYLNDLAEQDAVRKKKPNRTTVIWIRHGDDENSSPSPP